MKALQLKAAGDKVGKQEVSLDSVFACNPDWKPKAWRLSLNSSLDWLPLSSSLRCGVYAQPLGGARQIRSLKECGGERIISGLIIIPLLIGGRRKWLRSMPWLEAHLTHLHEPFYLFSHPQTQSRAVTDLKDKLQGVCSIVCSVCTLLHFGLVWLPSAGAQGAR